MLLKKRKDLLGDLVGGIGGGRARNNANPYDDGTETRLLFLSWQFCEEAGRVDGRPVNLPSLNQFNDLGTDSLPDIIERGVKDSTERLDTEIGESAGRPGEKCSAEIRAINEFWVVAVPCDAVIVRSPL